MNRQRKEVNDHDDDYDDEEEEYDEDEYDEERDPKEKERDEVEQLLAQKSLKRIEAKRLEKPEPAAEPEDHPVLNVLGFGDILVRVAIMAAILVGIAIGERPGALLPLGLFLGLAGLGLWIMFREVFIGEESGTFFSYKKAWVRWFAAVCLFIALILGIGGGIATAPRFFSAG